MLLSAAIWLQATDFFTYIRLESYSYAAIMSLHLVAISLFGGMLVLTDLRLLGWAMRGRPIADVVDQLRWPKRVGFVLAVTCGFLLFGSKAEEYYYNAFFRTKMTLFLLVGVHALVFRPSVYNRAEELDQALTVPMRAKVAAALSLMLWTGIMIAGRGIGYIEVPFGLHALLARIVNLG
jgi:uncharacterized membrane protein